MTTTTDTTRRCEVCRQPFEWPDSDARACRVFCGRDCEAEAELMAAERDRAYDRAAARARATDFAATDGRDWT